MTGKHPNHTHPDTADALLRRWQALELRKKRKSYRAIALELGCSVGAAYGYVKEALDELRQAGLETAAELRDLEVQKLDVVEEELTKRLEGADDQDAAKLSAVIVKTMESRRKLLGLDAPQKLEHQFTKGYVVKECSPDIFPPPPETRDDE